MLIIASLYCYMKKKKKFIFLNTLFHSLVFLRMVVELKLGLKTPNNLNI